MIDGTPHASAACPDTAGLLAVDLGLSTGWARFDHAGRLRWYRSQHFAHHAGLRRAGHRLLRDDPGITHVCLEGGGELARLWTTLARRRGVDILQVAAETWRRRLFREREHRSGHAAKQAAIALARRVIAWSDAPRPTALRHDTAEAIGVGLWAVLELGWLAAWPPS